MSTQLNPIYTGLFRLGMLAQCNSTGVGNGYHYGELVENGFFNSYDIRCIACGSFIKRIDFLNTVALDGEQA